jgi:hypothetical protein
VTNEIQYIIIILIIGAIALVYNLYGLWITPEKHIKKLINSVKDWWPFASSYRRWFASKAYLWLFRIIYIIWLLIVIGILSLLILGVMGLFP